MFRRRRSLQPDLSTRLRSEVRLWNVTPEASRIDIISGVCTICVDVPAQLYAVGTSQGEIRVYNGQYKETILTTPHCSRVELLQFSRSRDLFKLLCIDSTYTLHIWNLDVHKKPILQASQKLDGPIYRLSSCLKHSHALVATQSGNVVAYDLEMLKLSPYKICPALKCLPSSPAIDVALLSNRLNHVLISYPSGTVLYDLLSCEVIRTYNQAFDKTPSVMGLALHPIGQHYAAGYDDGTIRIWDLNVLDPLWVGNLGHKLKSTDFSGEAREPIFKMEWILFENGDGSSISWLVVLGGLLRSDDTIDGISVLGFDTTCFHSNMEFSTIFENSYLYPCSQPAQDFAILLADGSSKNSNSRLFVTSGSGNQGVSINAFKFPPELDHDKSSKRRDDTAVDLEFSADLEESKERSRNLAATLEDLESEIQGQESGISEYLPLRPVSLPLPLCWGTTTVLAAHLVSLNKREYIRLARQPDDDTAFGNKTLQYRLLITQHEDTSVKFYDVSALTGVNLSYHPTPLDHLTIHVLEIPEIALRPDIATIRVSKVMVAPVSLESIVQMTTGEIVVLGLGPHLRTQDVLDEEILDLTDVRDHGNIYTPRFILKAQKSTPMALCLSDIGFLAVSFRHGLLVVIDFRGPKIILRDMPNVVSNHQEENGVESLSWVISYVGDDTLSTPRLLVSRHDGSLTVFTLTQANNAWTVDPSRTTRHAHHGLKAPLLSVVIDAETGANCSATPARLADTLDELAAEQPRVNSNTSRSFWVVVNRREMRVYLNITGEKVAKVTHSSHDALEHVGFVRAHDSSVLVAFTRGRAVVYSLPALEAIHTFQLPASPKARDSIQCTSSGDILETFRSPQGITTFTLTPLLTRTDSSTSSGAVNFRQHKYAKTASVAEPSKSPAESEGTRTWGSSISNWIKGFVEETPVTGDEIDAILRGSRPGVEGEEVVNDILPAATSSRTEATGSASKAKLSNTSSTGDTVSPAVRWGQGMYQQLTSAAVERGERLGELQEHFQQLEAGSKDLVTQAKQLAERQAAKRWFL